MQLLNWNTKANELLIGEHKLSEQFGQKDFQTPLYLYDGNIILDRIKHIRKAFSEFTILYSVKSNPTLAICALMKQAGLGAEIASIGEFNLVRKLGFDLSKVAVTEPGKQADDLAKYINANVGMIHVESEREIRLVNKLSVERKAKTSVITRVNPLKTYPGAHEVMSGSSKFGIPEEEVVETLRRNQGKYVNFNGIHVFTGSQVLDQSVLIEKFSDTAQLAKSLSDQLGLELKQINFGGGFGVPYSVGETPLDISALGKAVANILNVQFNNLSSRPSFYLELGRYLVAESGIFLTKVIEVKHSRGTRFVLTDSGINNFARPAMPWAMQHDCAIISKMNSKSEVTYKVVGPLCQPSDILRNEVALPEPEPGDIIAFFNAGVYGFTMSPQFYHSKAMPAEILYYQNEFHTIRERVDNGELLFTQSIPEQLSEI